MKTATVDLIQVFCANFDCDIDLRYPPGVIKRFKSEVRWPDLVATNLFAEHKQYDRRALIHRLEIHLKRSRYTIEVMTQILGSDTPQYHLLEAVREHYSKTPLEVNFHPDMIVTALRALGLVSPDLNNEDAIDTATYKYEKWLKLSLSRTHTSD